MKKYAGIVLLVLLSFQLSGCEAKTVKPTTSNHLQAIEQSKTLGTTEEKVDFLLREAQGFLDTGQPEDAGFVCEHILDHLDAGSEKARRLARKAYEKAVGNIVSGQ